MSKIAFAVVFASSITLTAATLAQDVRFSPVGEQLPAPPCTSLPDWNTPAPRRCTAAELKEYHDDIGHWRSEQRIRMGINDAEYLRKELLWAQSSFVQPQMMVHDRYFYDPVEGHYTVSRYLDDLTKRYGGIDSVLIWPTYPNLGVDDRNQYDLFHDLPGGTSGIKQMIADFHQHGVRVLFPTMLWDQGTRAEGKADAIALSEQLVAVGADGINGDTLWGVPRSFREASDVLHHPLVLQPELSLGSDEMLNYNNMSWGYWKYGFAPSVSRYKWLESRHMVNLSNRWAHDHLSDLQEAFFNGIGFESWENVWGIWNQMTPRDAEALRRIAKIERATAAFLISPEWEPHTATVNFGVFASKWPKQREALWTVVNRNAYSIDGDQLEVPYVEGERFYDLWNGAELKPRVSNGTATLSFPLEASGYGTVLATRSLSPEISELLTAMQEASKAPLSSYSSQWKAIPQTLIPITATTSSTTDAKDMVKLPAKDFKFHVLGIEIEGMNDEGVDVQYPWESSARRYHDSIVHIDGLWIDKYPVTNQQFKVFLNTTHYAPKDDHNFLRDWKNGEYPKSWANKPVTWVSIEDARAYAHWAGKRLPHEWEWQYAAQGEDGRAYPWGNTSPTETGSTSVKVVPEQDTGRTMSPPSDVDAHPAGASPFGVMDMVGNVWQWTDVYSDEHTSAAIVRGGSHYRPQGSRWYFPQAYRNDQHSKYLLMAPSLDRSGAIGFRCVRDERESKK